MIEKTGLSSKVQGGQGVIREMKSTDYEQIFQIWKEIKGMGMRTLDDSYEGIVKFLARNPSTCFVAEEDGHVMGTILCGHDGRRAYIYHLAVMESHRGKQLGQNLVKAVEDTLEKEGIHKVALMVFTSNSTGNDFWERQGYTIREDLYYRNKSLNVKNQ